MPVNLQYSIPQPTADGVYPYAIPVQTGLPPAQQTNLIGRTGFAKWGPINSVQFYNTLSQAIYLWGDSASMIISKSGDASNGNNASLVAATQAAAPEGSNFADVRVDDGSSAAATGTLVDNVAGIVANLGAFYHGTDGNTITAQVSVYQGQFTSSGSVTPLAQLTVKINARPVWTSVPFVAGTIAGGYVAATFRTNLKSALLGTYGSGGTACPYIVYVSDGASTVAPVLTAQTFSGGTDGFNTWSGTTPSGVLIGTSAVGANTGIYCFQGVGINVLHCVGLTDLSQASTLATYAQSNTCVAFIADKYGTGTTTVISDKAANNASSPWLVVCNDFTYANDAVDASGGQYQDPACKTAAIVAQLAPYQYPGNKPYVGAQNLIGTYRSQTGIPYSNAELGQLEQAGVLVITRPIPRGASFFGLAHGMSSDGVTPISDTRMLNLVANSLTSILGNFVGESQTPPPAPGAADTDVTRGDARRAVSSYLSALANPVSPQIAAWEQIMDGTNNTAGTVAAGYLYDRILITTLAGIRFILLGLQVGETVTVDTTA